jgi:hypothetical protein
MISDDLAIAIVGIEAQRWPGEALGDIHGSRGYEHATSPSRCVRGEGPVVKLRGTRSSRFWPSLRSLLVGEPAPGWARGGHGNPRTGRNGSRQGSGADLRKCR